MLCYSAGWYKLADANINGPAAWTPSEAGEVKGGGLD